MACIFSLVIFEEKPKLTFGFHVNGFDLLKYDLISLRNKECIIFQSYCFTNFAVWLSVPYETSTTYIPALKVGFNGRLSRLVPSALFTFWFIRIFPLIS